MSSGNLPWKKEASIKRACDANFYRQQSHVLQHVLPLMGILYTHLKYMSSFLNLMFYNAYYTCYINTIITRVPYCNYVNFRNIVSLLILATTFDDFFSYETKGRKGSVIFEYHTCLGIVVSKGIYKNYKNTFSLVSKYKLKLLQ